MLFYPSGTTRSHPICEVVFASALRNDSVEFYVELYSYVDLYAEEELEHRVGRFFDDLVVHLVRGYEAAWQHGAA
jgi:hypothetical protein